MTVTETLSASLLKAKNQSEECRLYVLLDPSHNEQLIAAVQGMSTRHRCLFVGEDLEEFQEESPWIAEILHGEPLFDWLLKETFGKQQALYFVSNQGVDSLFTKLQRVKEVVEPSGELVYFRFYDANTLNRYLPVFSEGQRREFFSAMNSVYAEEGEEGFFTYTLNADATMNWSVSGNIEDSGIYPLPGLKTEEHDPSLPWFFTEEQLQYPLFAHRDELIDDLIEYLEYEEVETVRFYPKGFVRAMVNQGIEHCFTYKVLDLIHMRLFINLMWTINPQFHLQPSIHQVLSQSSSTEEKFDTLLSDDFEEVWIRAGAEKYKDWWPEGEGAS
ncbi:DUF4123 domain-containing protein [Grimontia sp. NTOU-MAR1]|uniref:DUF4123 domain-containing protein n=1 Tax=Grimontia sp. NTOU-MAR1 TaxID=3111011 RepID=UPI002DB5B5C6|nr:DUF4123 domain-containing protein [Grimontia sp. NTOU-MAR1]WRW00790.1 DUF4123 domain-containing protein [Grimontia sp. NTOU-MAR1]